MLLERFIIIPVLSKKGRGYLGDGRYTSHWFGVLAPLISIRCLLYIPVGRDRAREHR